MLVFCVTYQCMCVCKDKQFHLINNCLDMFSWQSNDSFHVKYFNRFKLTSSLYFDLTCFFVFSINSLTIQLNKSQVYFCCFGMNEYPNPNICILSRWSPGNNGLEMESSPPVRLIRHPNYVRKSLHNQLNIINIYLYISKKEISNLFLFFCQVVLQNGLANISLSCPQGMITGIEYKGINNLLEYKHKPSQRGYETYAYALNIFLIDFDVSYVNYVYHNQF